jgi:hypothetical protein
VSPQHILDPLEHLGRVCLGHEFEGVVAGYHASQTVADVQHPAIVSFVDLP